MIEVLDSDELGHSRVLNLDRIATSDNLKAALGRLMDDLKATEGSRRRTRRAADEERLAAMMEAIICDLYVNCRSDPSRYLGYSRDTSFYTLKSRYAHPLSSVTAVTSVADFLLHAGYAAGKLGFYDRRSNPFGGAPVRHMRSRIRATEKLLGLLECDYGVSIGDVGYRSDFEVIRLKDATKKMAEYNDTDVTNRMRSRLKEYNDLLAGCDIRLDGSAVGQSVDGTSPDFSSKRLYRVFNHSRFDHGGRFYGGWWQTVKAARRAHILIDGEETVEIDYSAMHCRMCYDLSGRSLSEDDDPYRIDGLESLRDAVKFGFLVLINLAPSQRGQATDKVKAMIQGKTSFRDLLVAIERRHRPIREWFRSGKGTELQCIDSKVAESVMGYFVGRGIPCLPIHDSFIVPSSARKQLDSTMREAYAAHVRSPNGNPSYPSLK